MVDFVNGVFAEALSRRASDIHVEPFADHFAVRLRIDGVLVTIRTAPRARFDAVCSRIKLLSGMDVGERRLPQDGRQSIRAAGQELDLRVSSLPSLWGESLVLRLLGRVDRLPKLAELGVSDAQAAKLLALVEQPNGLVLVSGPPDQRQDHHHLSAAGPPQQRRAQDRHRGRPGRVRAAGRGAGAGGTRPRPLLRGRHALDPAPGSGRDHGRRDPTIRKPRASPCKPH